MSHTLCIKSGKHAKRCRFLSLKDVSLLRRCLQIITLYSRTVQSELCHKWLELFYNVQYTPGNKDS